MVDAAVSPHAGDWIETHQSIQDQNHQGVPSCGTRKKVLRAVFKYRMGLAKANGYRVVRIDVDYKAFRNRFDYCKYNIIESLNFVFDFSKVDWEKANENAMTSFYIPVCDRYNEGYTIKQIAEEFALWPGTVRDYLVQGTKDGITSYDSNIKLTKKYFEEKGFKINSRRDTAEAMYTLITEYIKMHPDKTREQIAEELGISSTSVWNYLHKYPQQYGFSNKNKLLPRNASPRKKLERRKIEKLPDNAVKCRNQENLYIDLLGNVYRKASNGQYWLLPNKPITVRNRIEAINSAKLCLYISCFVCLYVS